MGTKVSKIDCLLAVVNNANDKRAYFKKEYDNAVTELREAQAKLLQEYLVLECGKHNVFAGDLVDAMHKAFTKVAAEEMDTGTTARDISVVYRYMCKSLCRVWQRTHSGLSNPKISPALVMLENKDYSSFKKDLTKLERELYSKMQSELVKNVKNIGKRL